MRFPERLDSKLENRAKTSSLRSLILSRNKIDFASNDYLGIALNSELESIVLNECSKLGQYSSTGSRLLTGNFKLVEQLENQLAVFHETEAALVFNSGYDANLGFLSCVPQRGDIVLYDALVHTSIREGLQLGLAKSYSFKHNDLFDLEESIKRLKIKDPNAVFYIVTESVFSMDGDTPDLIQLVQLAKKYNCLVVLDEAHATGVFGNSGCGKAQELGIQDKIFARIHTFGKALGSQGAAIVGSQKLKEYLFNFSRAFIYTTALPPYCILKTLRVYLFLEEDNNSISTLRKNIIFFKKELKRLDLQEFFIESDSAIHCAIIGGTLETKKIAILLQQQGFDIRPILAPTVQIGKERLRFCIHSFNSFNQITQLLEAFKEHQHGE